MNSNYIPFFLITGFLGSGKTTLLKHFLQTYASKKRLLVIQNEFGETSIDAIELRRMEQKFDLLEVNKGSVFCVCLLSDFRSSLKEAVLEFKPEAVLLEATGLADPLALAQIMEAPDLKEIVFLNYVWCVVDASTFLKMETLNTRIAHQVRIADELIINKIDLSDEVILKKLEVRLKELNPFAKITRATYSQISFNSPFNKIEEPVALKRKQELWKLELGERPKVSTLTLRLTNLMEKEALEKFLSEYAERCYRIKGYVNLKDGKTLAVQCIAGKCEFKEIKSYNSPTEIIFLGSNFDERKLKSEFLNQCLSKN